MLNCIHGFGVFYGQSFPSVMNPHVLINLTRRDVIYFL